MTSTDEQQRIEKLTPEQEAQLSVYRDKWIAIGLQTGLADRERAEAGVKLIYEAADLPHPDEIVWVDSPYAGHKKAKEFTDDPKPLHGQHSAAWLSFYEYFYEVVGLECVKPLVGFFEVAKSAGWWWCFDKLAIMSERASESHMDEQGRLHREAGPAIVYPDGWGVYSWHGVRVPEKVIMDPSSLTVDEIQAEQNIEVRRIMIERYGVGDFLHQTKAEIVDMDASPIAGGAPRVLMRDSQGLQFLCGTDGSTKRVYFMSVPDDVATCKAAHEAICGFSEDRLVAES
jgi:hypothetical protein